MTQGNEIQKKLLIQAPLHVVKETILNTEDYPSFIGPIRKSYVHEKGVGFSDVLFHVRIITFPIQYRLETKIEDPLNISFIQTTGYFEEWKGRWILKDLGSDTLLEYHSTFKFPPFALPKLVQGCQESFFPDMIHFFKFEIEKRAKKAA